MKKYSQEELAEILELHRKWYFYENGGIRANLTGADLTDANLIRANLIRANLIRADLTGADLTDADLTDANLIRANLIRANLIRANLIRANLTDADLTGANLTGANLTGANYDGELIRWVLQLGPIGSRKGYLQIFAVGCDRLIFHAGCYKGNLTEFVARVQSVHGDSTYGKQYMAAIEFAKIMLPPKEDNHAETISGTPKMAKDV